MKEMKVYQSNEADGIVTLDLQSQTTQADRTVMEQAIHRTINLLLVAIFITPAILYGGEPGRDALFHIERNKNANIVQYDVQVGEDGMLHSKEPVVAYWVRLAEKGQVEKLTWIQRKFAYGFVVKLNKEKNTATLDLALDIDRTIVVERDGDDYRALTQINGISSYVDRIFIHASGKGTSTRVDYIELYGNTMDNRDESYERITLTR